MGIHHVKPGECFSAIAARHGFHDPARVYQHPANAEFRRRRPDWNQIFPGDEIFIPEPERRESPIATGQTHHFKVRPGRKTVTVRFRDRADAPRAGLRYVFTAEGEDPREGVTDAAGAVVEAVALAVEHVRIELPPDETYEVSVGGIDPVERVPDDGVSGACARLRNLGYDVRATRVDDPAFVHAIAAFQVRARLAPTGRLDAPTAAALRADHGS